MTAWIHIQDNLRAPSDETLDAIRDARDLQLLARGSLHRALRARSREAHAKALPTEDVLAALKKLWYSLPDVQRARDRGEQTRQLEGVIATCLEEYCRT